MPTFYDFAYALGLAAATPIWATRPKSRAKVLSAFRERFGQMPARAGDRRAIWIHCVSLGEVNAARTLVQALLDAQPRLDVVLSTTTTTGHERLATLYACTDRIFIVRYPLDFSKAIRRALDAIRPSVVVLMELETWPNFLLHCQRRGIPVVLANGRITRHSYSRYRWIRPIVRTMFRRLAAICVQDAEYAGRFEALGAPREKITIAGTMKYDTADIADTVAGAEELQSTLRLEPSQPLWVCGSTGPGEEAIVLRVYRQLFTAFPTLRLAIIPRHPQRFEEVAELIQSANFPLLRRSLISRPVLGARHAAILNINPSDSCSALDVGQEASPPNPANPLPVGSPHSALSTSPPIVLGDTMGELRKFYALATVVFVGRSLVDLGSRQHGSDMIEPAALAKPCVVGPFTGNFDQAVRALQSAKAIVEVRGESELSAAIRQLLTDPTAAWQMGSRAQEVVRGQRGSTQLHAATIWRQLERTAADDHTPPK